MLTMLASLASIISIIGVPFLLLPGFWAACAHWAKPDGVPECWLDVGTMEAIMSLRGLCGGFAMGILIDGVMGCRTYGGFMQVFCGS